MPTERPQYYENDLKPVEISKESLQKTLKELRVAAIRGTEIVQNGSPPPSEWGAKGFFNGSPGIPAFTIHVSAR